MMILIQTYTTNYSSMLYYHYSICTVYSVYLYICISPKIYLQKVVRQTEHNMEH